ncbi:MAG: hypothetical protein KC506_03320 [Nanoarchaeota archaeon]|nr:hypothetical protein [Nanoarchaeota archaeon]
MVLVKILDEGSRILARKYLLNNDFRCGILSGINGNNYLEMDDFILYDFDRQNINYEVIPEPDVARELGEEGFRGYQSHLKRKGLMESLLSPPGDQVSVFVIADSENEGRVMDTLGEYVSREPRVFASDSSRRVIQAYIPRDDKQELFFRLKREELIKGPFKFMIFDSDKRN